MASRSYPVGILFSASGSYGTVGRTMLNGALLACQQVNDELRGEVRLQPVEADPGSDLQAYAPAAEAMLNRGIRHVVGCYTSSSRKEVIPLFEKRDALLWYPAHYEGFESSTNVVYTGAAPNHHMLPLVDYLLAQFGDRAFCVGSNYIWAWESNRVLRDELSKRSGRVCAERYLAVGETDVARIIETIFDLQPDFVFNTLIGESAYAFFRAFRRACGERGIDQTARYPIASCNLSEPELHEIGVEARDGHISSSVYFSTIDSPANRRFVADYNAAFPDGPAPSAEAEAAFIAVKLLAGALADAGSADIWRVRESVSRQVLTAPQGEVSIDPDTLHAYLTPRIGRSRSDAQFDIVVKAKTPVRPDPYLVRSAASIEAAPRRSALRVVS
jgi:urea transport system substrate-binding protein